MPELSDATYKGTSRFTAFVSIPTPTIPAMQVRYIYVS